jgi:hypothetical protein
MKNMELGNEQIITVIVLTWICISEQQLENQCVFILIFPCYTTHNPSSFPLLRIDIKALRTT